jgi:2-methylcitrate dehydratase PrpD
VLPALLAEAEYAGISTRRTLACAAIAYEVVTRFAATWHFPNMAEQGRGWVHARFNSIGAAVATSLVRQSPADLASSALENAISMALIGPRRHHLDGALVWNAWPATATWIGMTSVDWAECGIAGLASTPSDVMGVEFRGEARWSSMTEGLGKAWAILDGYTKIHACIQHAHSTVEAVLAARPAVLAHHGEILELLVETHRLALFLDQPDPLTSLAAKFSLQHIAATTYVHGSAGPEAFSAASLSNPQVAALRMKVRFAPFGEMPGAHDRPARVSFVMTDGTRVARTCLSAAGGPDRPFGDETVWGKVESLTRDTAPQFNRLARSLERLDPDWIDRPWPEFVRAALAA